MTALANGQPAPVVGMGVTEVTGSDYRAYFITEVSPSGKTIEVQRAKTRRTDSNGLSESQDWTIEPDTNGTRKRLSLRKDGYFRTVGSSMEWWNRWGVGNAREYMDPHF